MSRRLLPTNTLSNWDGSLERSCGYASFFFRIPSAARDHGAHTSPRLFRVGAITGDDVDMDVRDGLACFPAHVDAEVESIGMESLVDAFARGLNQPQHIADLALGKLEDICDMPC